MNTTELIASPTESIQNSIAQQKLASGNVFFVGLMGAGKTTIGRALAKCQHKHFYDADHEIERRTGVNIPLIFELEGEEGFRKRETAVIIDLCQSKDIIMATGGGAVMAAENKQALKQNGIVIYLRAHVNELWLRTRNDKNRPLLQTDNPKEKLEQLLKIRDPHYIEVADYIVETASQPVSHIVSKIEQLLKNHHANT